MHIAQVLALHPCKGHAPEHAAGQLAEQHVEGMAIVDVGELVAEESLTANPSPIGEGSD